MTVRSYTMKTTTKKTPGTKGTGGFLKAGEQI